MSNHVCDTGYFDRTLCACRAMHSYCDTCGSLQDSCPYAETPTQHPAPEVVALTEGEREVIPLSEVARTAKTWHEYAHPTAEELADWLVTIPRSDLVEMAARFTVWGEHHTYCRQVELRARAESAEAERDTARREADDLRARLGAAKAEALLELADDIDPNGYGWTSIRDAVRFQQRLRDRAALADPAAGMTEKGGENA